MENTMVGGGGVAMAAGEKNEQMKYKENKLKGGKKN